MKSEAKNITIFTDGSSRGNPGPGGWGTIVVVGDKVKEIGGREAHTTNNRMELTAAAEALREISELSAKNMGAIVVYTDSKYLINGVTKWIAGWKVKGWKTIAKKDVENRDLWEMIDSAVEKIGAADGNIKWQYVAGHSEIPANERCDVIATTFADDQKIDLYDGALAAYSIDVEKVALGAGEVSSSSSKSRSKLKAFSYLSLVDGVAKRDMTWPECEARVKGARGAKYKKAISAADEANILKEWGVSL